MTDGSSQGLFVVVAVVIFGIFVAISYMLFRDQLTPSLANIFRDSIGQSTKKLTTSLISTADIRERASTPEEVVLGGKPSDYFSNNGMEIFLYNSTGTEHQGIYLDSSYLEDNKEYELTFDYYSPDASIGYLAGHFTRSSETKIYVNNNYISSCWHVDKRIDVEESNWIAPDTNKHNVRVEFNTYAHGGANRSFYIQPNRLVREVHAYTAVFSNFKLVEK